MTDIHTRTHKQTHMHTHTQTHMHSHTHKHTHTQTHTHTHTHKYTHTHTTMHFIFKIDKENFIFLPVKEKLVTGANQFFARNNMFHVSGKKY